MKYPMLAREFPKFDHGTLPAIPETWIESSWHNDTCPSFIAGDPDGKHCQIFIDYLNVDDRELGDCCPRFCVNEKDGDDCHPVSLETDDWDDVLSFVGARQP